MNDEIIKIFGAIDGIALTGNTIAISGWAFADIDGQRKAVDSLLFNSNELPKVTHFNRPDIDQDNTFGFQVEATSIEMVASIYFNIQPLSARSGISSGQLKFWSKLNNKILAILLREKIEKGDEKSIADLASPLVALIDQTPYSEIAPQDLTVQLGMLNIDKSVIVGKEGHLFLYGGTNELKKQYDCKPSQTTVDRWTNLISNRAARSKELGAKYLQVFIPEKQSVSPELFPDSITTPTPLLQIIQNHERSSKHILDAHNVLRTLFTINGLHPFRKTDSHLSFHGALSLANALHQEISGKDIAMDQPRMFHEYASGDLGKKFGFGNVLEKLNSPDESSWDFAKNKPNIIRRVDPQQGHTGTMRAWKQEKPLLDKTVLVFGNSMFERGINPSGLSWWMSHIFREFIFFWSASMDDKLIALHRPDIVICQTVERFMPSVPSE